MALAMDNNTFYNDLDLSDYTTSTNTSHNFHELINSLIEEEHAPYPYPYPYPTRPDISNSENPVLDQKPATGEADFKALRLYHLLTAAADAVYAEPKSRDLAHVILARLKELASPAAATNLERLAAYYTEAMQRLLQCAAGKSHLPRDDHAPSDAVAAFQLLQEISPYVKFAHFTANQAILEAVVDYRRIHIVDYDIMEGIQWPSFMQALVSNKSPPQNLRITAISRPGNGRRFIGSVQETGRRLSAFAASINQPFSFHQCKLNSDEIFKPSDLKLVKGEALVINCMLHLLHFSYRNSESVASFLSGAKTLNPRVVTLVEEEFEHGSNKDGDYKVRFLDSLERYSAIYDSFEAGFGMKSRGLGLVERVFLGPRISATVMRIGEPWREEEDCCWGERLGKMGFREKAMSFANQCQARLLVGLFNGYRVEELGDNKLVLGWKSKRLLSTSIWASSSSSSLESG